MSKVDNQKTVSSISQHTKCCH